MADGEFSRILSRNPAEVRVCGRFKPNGSSAITNTQGSTIFGRGFSVARTNTGVFTITLRGTFGNYLHGDLTLMSSTIADGGQFRVVSVTASGGNTALVVTHYGEDAGGVMQAEDIASAADNFVTFEFVFSNLKAVR